MSSPYIPDFSEIMAVAHAWGTDSEASKLWDGAVGLWPFPEGGGVMGFDVSGEGNDGTLTNGPTWVTSEKGWGLGFNATEGQYADLGAVSRPMLTTGQPFSLLWWENVTADTDDYPARFIFSIAGTATHFSVLRVKPAGAFNYLHWGRSPHGGTPGVQATDVTPPASAIGIWKQFCITGQDPVSGTPGDYAIYEDSVARTASVGGSLGVVTGNRIGWDGVDHGANCKIRAVAIYNRILTPPEIQQLYVDPDAMFRLRRRVYAAAAVAAFQPAWTNGINQHIGLGI